MSHPIVSSTASRWVQFVAHTPLAAAVGALLFYSRRSLDFSDESLYLYLTSSPTQESTLAGVWNWYLNIFYRISGDDIVLYRQISVVIAFTCSYLFSWAYFSSTYKPMKTKIGITFPFMPVILAATSTVFFYRYTLITPGYNWLALIGVLLSIAGALKWLSGNTSMIWPALSVLGLGLTTMARPTSGIVIFLAMLCYRKIRTDIFKFTFFGRIFFLSIFGFAVLHHLLLVSASVTIKALRQTYLAAQVDKSHSFLSLLSQATNDLINFPLHAVSISKGLILIPVFFILINFATKNKKIQSVFQATLVLSSLAGFAVLLILNQMVVYTPSRGGDAGSSLATLVLFGFLAALSLGSLNESEESGILERNRNKYSGNASVLLLGGILGFAFSSNNGLLNQSAGIGILYIALYLSFILRISQQKWELNFLTVNVIFLVIVFSQVLYGAWQNPYRSVNLSENTYSVIVGGGNKILVSKSRAEDISKVKSIADEIDAKNANLYLVDLSPFTTYIPYELEFKTIETPLITESAYLDGFAQRNKDLLQKAWILTSNSKRALDPNDLMSVLGKSLEDDYQFAYSLDGNYCQGKTCKLMLWKPK